MKIQELYSVVRSRPALKYMVQNRTVASRNGDPSNSELSREAGGEDVEHFSNLRLTAEQLPGVYQEKRNKKTVSIGDGEASTSNAISIVEIH